MGHASKGALCKMSGRSTMGASQSKEQRNDRREWDRHAEKVAGAVTAEQEKSGRGAGPCPNVVSRWGRHSPQIGKYNRFLSLTDYNLS